MTPKPKQKRQKIDLRAKPRWLEHLKATVGGYFWLPCPMCGEYFGGHEKSGDLCTSYGGGYTVCINCAKKAERINKKNNYFIPDHISVEL